MMNEDHSAEAEALMRARRQLRLARLFWYRLALVLPVLWIVATILYTLAAGNYDFRWTNGRGDVGLAFWFAALGAGALSAVCCVVPWLLEAAAVARTSADGS